MSKILIVGHSSSHYKKLEEILQSYGVSKPVLSHTHQMTPQQIGKQILESAVEFNQQPMAKKTSGRRKSKSVSINNAKNLPNIDSNILTKYSQKTPKKVWSALAFDLILANDNQDLWGWSDDKAVSLLEYWANFDEELFFVLVYDTPHVLIESFMQNINSAAEITDDTINKALEDWCDYNKELLDFYHKYPERCFLVNGEQAIYSTQNYIEILAKKLIWQPQVVDLQTLRLGVPEHAQVQTVRFFVDQLLSGHHNLVTIFGLLQESADIAWEHFKPVYNQLDLLRFALQEHIELGITKHALLGVQESHKDKEQDWKNQLDTSQKIHLQDKKALDDTQQLLKKSQEENNVIIAQLHQIQEELEKYYLENQQSKEKLKVVSDELAKAKKQTEEEKKQFKNLTEAKTKAEQQSKVNQEKLNATQKELESIQSELQKAKQTNSNQEQSLQKENDLLIAQLHQTQEELEKYYLENQHLKVKTQSKELAKPVYYGAADRVKQDLPYRIGQVMVSHSKSTKDLAKLPFALVQEYRDFQKNQDNAQALPPVEEYQDVDEAEKIKKHLSYRLGKTLIDGVKSPKGILDLPVKMGREIVGFKK